MTRYNDEPHCTDFDFDGDFDDQMHDQKIVGYQDGVARVLRYIESINAYPKLVGELKWAIEEGII